MNSDNNPNQGESDIDISRPVVTNDGEIVRHEIGNKEIELKGKTIEVYQYLAKNPGFHGVREIQRILDYSSPGLTMYHLKRLLSVDAIVKNQDGQYGIAKDPIKLGSLDDHIRFIKFWIPRTFIISSISLSNSCLNGVFVLEVLNANDDILFIFSLSSNASFLG